MEDTTLIIGALATLIAAFGIKEIWNIWKKKIDIQAAKEIREEEKINWWIPPNPVRGFCGKPLRSSRENSGRYRKED